MDLSFLTPAQLIRLAKDNGVIVGDAWRMIQDLTAIAMEDRSDEPELLRYANRAELLKIADDNGITYEVGISRKNLSKLLEKYFYG